MRRGWRIAVVAITAIAPLATVPAVDAQGGGPDTRSPRATVVGDGSRPTPVAPDSRHDVRLCAGGDVTLGTNLDTAWAQRTAIETGDPTGTHHTPEALVGALRPLMHGADLVVVNAEGAIGDGPVGVPKCDLTRKNCYLLRAPLEAARAIRHLADSGAVVVVNVANNHLHDAGARGVVATIDALDSAGVLVTGADTAPTLAVTARGDTIAVLGFSVWSDPSVNDLDRVRHLVANAVDRYGRVVVTAHVGAEGRAAQRTPNAVEYYVGEDRGNSVAFAHAAVEAGATVVIGHGPHVLRAVEWWNSALILYSMGNLINYGPFHLAPPMNRGAVVCATLDSAGTPRDAVLHATRQPMPGTVLRDSTNRARVLVDSLSRLDFPATGATIDPISGAILERGPVAPEAERGAVSPRRPERPSDPNPAPPASNRPPSQASPAGPPATA